MKVWIVSTKNFKGKTYIHGITEEGKNVRLLDENGMYPLPDRHSYVPGEIYEMLLRDPVDGGDPFWENKCVVSQKWSGYECNLRQFLLNRLTLPRPEGRGFFLHPACLRGAAVRRRVAAGCPEAFDETPSSVPVCPTVPCSALCKIFKAAL
ncbi:hypothetical protein EI42_06038 [Thermosporothrix hazakensis]|jgi:hypothetical protein|uniref:Uncharacterized protein n=1 Tax=Thermosporothrix hazakensis TaxID=644383 RepID=A0A326U698_THEHA|nr:hypothetical protein EI42_06038 [Thermosporothrix hazakensis]